jgi:serine/threonine protein kinase
MITGNDDLVGTTLGTCTIVKRIGQGGMSTVYVARQTHPARNVAVKILRPRLDRSLADQKTFLARFRREADIVARLEHINIIPIFEYGEQNQLAYLVMPYISGGSLSQMLDREGSFPLEQALNYIQQAAAALDYAHARNVIHRDLKPGNFLIYPDGRLVLADFGIARMLGNHSEGSTLTMHGAFLGTPAYMSPEMFRGEPVDHRTDIYALGIVLFEMLSGDIPFRGENAFVVMNKHLQQPLPSLHAKDPHIPLTVDAVLQKATAKRREDRYMSAGALARDLQLAILGIPHDELGDYRSGQMQDKSSGLLSQETSGYESNAVTSSNHHVQTSDMKPSLPQNRQHFWPTLLKTLPLVVLLIAGLIGLRIAGVFAGSSQPAPAVITPASIPTLIPTEQAKAVIQQYYADINSQDYQAAYALLSPNFQSSLSYTTFSNGYAQDQRDDVTFDSITQNSDGSVTAVTTLHVLKRDSTTSTYSWTARVVQQPNGSWKIDSATIKPA